MAKKRKDPGRHVGPFRLGDPATRKNSASIRRFFHDIIAHHFDGSLSRGAAALTEALNTAEDRRAYRRGFSENTAYLVQKDDQTISFNELDSMGLFYGVPLALVVLFTQVRSEVQNDPGHMTERAKRTLRAFGATVIELEQIIEDMPAGAKPYQFLSHDKFVRLQQVFRAHFGEIQTNLPLPDFDADST